MRGALRATRGSSTRGQGRGCLPGRRAPSQWATGLDMARGSLEPGRAFVQGAVDMDVPEFPALEAGFMVSGMITSERSIMVTASPPDFSVLKGSFFLFGQRG